MDSSKASLANRQLDWTYCCWSLSFNLLENDWMDVLINSIVVTLYTQPSNLHLAHMRNPTPSSWSAGPPCSSSILLCQCTGIQVKTTPPSHLAWVSAQSLLLAAPHTHFTPYLPRHEEPSLWGSAWLKELWIYSKMRKRVIQAVFFAGENLVKIKHWNAPMF